jgi:hypothetical protein
VFHYAAILFASLIALIPTQTPLWLGISMGSIARSSACSIRSLSASSWFRDHVADITDLLGYGGCPVVT